MVKKGKKTPRRPILKQKYPNPKMLKKLAVAILITLVAAVLYTHLASHTQAAKDQRKLQETYIQLNVNKQTLQKEINDHKLTNDEQNKKIEELNKQLQDTQSQLQAKKDSATVYAATVPLTPSYTAPVASSYAPTSPDEDKAFIYAHESGNRTDAINPIGACGLGQALPCSKMGCSLSDYACQDSFFTGYMQSRYGTWANARAFWENNRWW